MKIGVSSHSFRKVLDTGRNVTHYNIINSAKNTREITKYAESLGIKTMTENHGCLA